MDTIYIFSNGELKKKDNTIELITNKGKKTLPINNINDIKVFSNVKFNNKFLALLTKYKVIMHIFSYYQNYLGSYVPYNTNYEGKTIINQVNHHQIYEERLKIAKALIFSAMKNMLKNLNESKIIIDNEKKDTLILRLLNSESIEAVMVYEAEFRRMYYSKFDEIMNGSKFKFKKRSKRPPKNEINSVISFGNTIMYTDLLRVINKVGLSNSIGYIHSSDRKNTLNLDVSEIFKPIIIDKIVFEMFKNNKFNKTDFVGVKNGIYLSDNGKKKFIVRYNEKLDETIKLNNRFVSYKELMEIELYKLKKYLNGKEFDYKPYMEV